MRGDAAFQDLLPSLHTFFEHGDGQIIPTLEAFARGHLDPEETAAEIAAFCETPLQRGDLRQTDKLWNALVEISRHSGRERSSAVRMSTLLNSLSNQDDVADAATASAQSSWTDGGI